MFPLPPLQPDEVGDPVARATALAGLFCSPPERFGRFRPVTAAGVPEPYRGLLDHDTHMTVAMERFHGGPVSLKVVATVGGGGTDAARATDEGGVEQRYAREILLIGPSGTVVQHGIVRLDLTRVDRAVAASVRDARVPLGRILIDAGLLRDVQRVRLLEVLPGPHLATLFDGLDCGRFAAPTFGRVAEISLDGRPAVELLEIVAPMRA